jgi:Flp pilus assembly protein CpaB
MRLSHRLRLFLATRPIVYWSLTLALAAGTATVVQRATADAAEARHRWGDTQPTLVATRPVAVGETLGPANAAIRDVPVALRPDGALGALPDPPAPAIAAPLSVGEVVTAARLGRAGRSPMAGLLPDGTSGVAVPAPDGLPLQPGDVVDVIDASGTAHDATVVGVDDGTAVVAVPQADAPAVARAAHDGDAVLVLSADR